MGFLPPEAKLKRFSNGDFFQIEGWGTEDEIKRREGASVANSRVTQAQGRSRKLCKQRHIVYYSLCLRVYNEKRAKKGLFCMTNPLQLSCLLFTKRGGVNSKQNGNK